MPAKALWTGFLLLAALPGLVGLAAPAPTVKIAVLSDLTGSAVKNSTPAVTPASLEPLISCVVDKGGVLGVTAVRDRAEGGLVRLAIDAPAPRPVEPNLDRVPLFQQKTVLQRYLQTLNAWKADEAKRLARSDEKLRAFRAELQATLLPVRTDKQSDVVGAVRRVDRFLMEPAEGAARLLLVASDMEHTAGEPSKYEMVARATTAWAYRSAASPRQVPLPSPVATFEGLDAAVDYLRQQCR